MYQVNINNYLLTNVDLSMKRIVKISLNIYLGNIITVFTKEIKFTEETPAAYNMFKIKE